MTDEEKLEVLERYETVYWEALQSGMPTGHVESYNLKNLERCQRIRKNLLEEDFGIAQITYSPVWNSEMAGK